MNENYKTVKQFGSAEMIEKKSRFIGYCCPVKTEDEALEFINAIKAKHREATHNVYAYIVRENNIMRYSDDGEPGGTAGMPTLEVLRKEGLTDVAVVVTRYFGGVLLGAGGLVRAYGKSARLGVDAAVRIEKLMCRIYSVKTDYSMYGKLQYAVLEGGYILKDTLFTDVVELIVCVKLENCAAFEKMIVEERAGRTSAEAVSTE
ncbi:MAG: YigZ family protein, partial [Clostridia bacterium]